MLRIRLLRTGKRNRPFFRIVVTEKKNPPRGGRFLEVLGFYDPLTKEKGLKTERIKYWLSVGAKPSDSVYNLLVKEKVLEGKKIPVHKKSKKKEATPTETLGTKKAPEAPEGAEKAGLEGAGKERVEEKVTEVAEATEAIEEIEETEAPGEEEAKETGVTEETKVTEEKKDEKDTE